MKDLLKHERPVLENSLLIMGEENKIAFNHLAESPVLTRSYEPKMRIKDYADSLGVSSQSIQNGKRSC